jgi:hypothetical protein
VRAIVITPDYEATPWEPSLNFYAEKRGLTQGKAVQSAFFRARPRFSAFPPQAFEGLSVT